MTFHGERMDTFWNHTFNFVNYYNYLFYCFNVIRIKFKQNILFCNYKFIPFCCFRLVTKVSSVFQEEPLNPTSQAVCISGLIHVLTSTNNRMIQLGQEYTD